jgi:ferredoxin-NADP reductase
VSSRGPLLWQLGQVAELIQETPRVGTLKLQVPEWPGHVAGQHVDVRLTAEDGYQAQRSYSIASAPEDSRLAITVERLEDGEVSPYLVGELKVGDKVELRGPIGGYFVWEGSAASSSEIIAKPLLLIAGGSGIVPLMSMLRHREAVGNKAPTRLLYSSRTINDIIYKNELDRLTSSDDGLKVVHTLTRSQPSGWKGYGRRIDRGMVRDVAWPTDQAPAVFICGPTAFVETAADLLVELGYEPGLIKTERFGATGG